MKTVFILSAIIVTVITTNSCKSKFNNKQNLKNDNDSLSYYLGIFSGLKLKESGYTDFNKKDFELSINKAFSEEGNNIKEQENANMAIYQYLKIGLDKVNLKTLNEGREFLAKNKTRKGIITTPSGLQYKIIRQGKGIKPQMNDSIQVHFRGYTLDGTEFVSSDPYAQPDKIIILLRGCKEGIHLMPMGSKYVFYLPTELAYGRNPIPGGILKPNMAVIFEIEMLNVIPKNKN